MALAQALAYARVHRVRFVETLQDFIRLPSISVQPERAADVRCCAGWLADQLRRVGLAHVEVIPTPRHPIVYATWRGASGCPTVLIYGHYDVQPIDPLEAWHIPPFEPVVRGS